YFNALNYYLAQKYTIIAIIQVIFLYKTKSKQTVLIKNNNPKNNKSSLIRLLLYFLIALV
ncbi:hypothetical protein, partial [Sphingobacterium sp. T2]|uniref:hypothetical protein n=1 Tax=Sphingobacterium sp. T2 TaxID=1590596 RepID=UPI00057B87A9